MPFLGSLITALVLAALGLGTGFFAGPGSTPASVLFGLGVLGGLLLLVVSAIGLRARRIPRFDMMVAAEVIVAYGILSLVLGLALAISNVLRSDVTQGGIQLEELRPLLTPFVEGLVAAGVAPLAAVALRQLEVLKYGAAELADSSPEARLAELDERVRKVSEAFDNLATSCRKSAEEFEKNASRFADTAGSWESAARKTKGALDAVASSAESGRSTLETAFGTIAAEADKARGALSGAVSEFGELAGAFGRLRSAAAESSRLLEELQKLIASVERFIRPEDR